MSLPLGRDLKKANTFPQYPINCYIHSSIFFTNSTTSTSTNNTSYTRNNSTLCTKTGSVVFKWFLENYFWLKLNSSKGKEAHFLSMGLLKISILCINQLKHPKSSIGIRLSGKNPTESITRFCETF